MLGIRLESSTTDGMQPALPDSLLPSHFAMPFMKGVLDTLAGVSAAMQENQDGAWRGHPPLGNEAQSRPSHAATWESFVNHNTGPLPLAWVCTKEPPASDDKMLCISLHPPYSRTAQCRQLRLPWTQAEHK